LIGSGSRPVERRSIGFPASIREVLMEPSRPYDDVREEAKISDVIYADGAGIINELFVVQ